MTRTDDWGDGWNEGREQAILECIAAVEAVHSPIQVDDDLSYCRGCSDAAYNEYSFPWPCPVVTAVHALQEKIDTPGTN